MNRIGLILIAVVWLVILAFIGMSMFVSPSKEQGDAVKSLVTTIQNYLDSKPIDPESVSVDGPNGRFVRATAVMYRDIKKSEDIINQQDSQIRIFVDKSNLQNPEVLQTNLTKIDAYIATANQSFEQIETIVQTYADEIANIKQDDDMLFPVAQIRNSILEARAMREDARNNRIAMAENIRAMLTFIFSRQSAPGYMEFTPTGVKFTYPDDQAYYSAVAGGYFNAAKKVDDYKALIVTQLRDSITPKQ